ncbi:MAG: transposase, partial [Thermodesulfobacteriota bacterium]|nr:transposase [Thermodesulfobacteriota bacterium]
YGAYDFLDHIEGIIHVACWIHARRKFMEVAKAAGNKDGKPTGIAGNALKYISKLYKIERGQRTWFVC